MNSRRLIASSKGSGQGVSEPLVAQGGTRVSPGPMSLTGSSATFERAQGASALPLIPNVLLSRSNDFWARKAG